MVQQQRTRVEPTRYGRAGRTAAERPAERIGLAGVATVSMSWRYGGVDAVSTLWVTLQNYIILRVLEYRGAWRYGGVEVVSRTLKNSSNTT